MSHLNESGSITLSSLPKPPENKAGWPWTEASDPVRETAPDGSDWPKISIVTPSYNQGQFIEETIRSILLQRYPNLEYIVMDGGSDDNTVEILPKYDPWIDH
jgi:cellulose synthase/poly-beta-1,6-N-acetylglucosamine synthase-like glycosyltransferase